MKVILLDEIKGKGGEGDVVEVAQGYAENFLFPKKLAVAATKGNLKQLDERRNNIAKREAVRLATANETKAAFEGKTVTVDVKVGDEGILFGSVTAAMVADAIKAQLGMDIDRKRVELGKPIKVAGAHTVAISLYREIKAEVVVLVGVTAEELAAEAEVEEAAEVAEAETAEVETAVEPEVALESTELADEAESAPAEEAAPLLPEVTVLDASATQAILDNGRGYAQFCDMAVLAFASFTTPGGGYIQGYLGQEATLCADSYLYNVLDKQRKWYGENRRRNINCELYRNRALVVPAVRFDRNHVHAYADVIVAAAPNAKRARQEYRVSDDALLDALRDRIRFVLAICDELGREKLVLGAWGCDNNGFDAETVAELFRKELASGDFKVKQVFFAVPSTRWDEDFAKFEHVLANFPARNEESYAQVAARAAAARAAEQAQAATEDDEDEEDL